MTFVLRTSLLVLLSAAFALSASILEPEWSRPLPAPVVSASARSREDGTEDLFLLLADRSVVKASQADTLTRLGRAPEGTTALLALPCVCVGAGSPARGTCETNAALLLAGRKLVAWNHEGHEVWRTPLEGPGRIDSMAFIGWREGRPELCAWHRGEPWLVNASHEQMRARKLDPGFLPQGLLIADIDRDGRAELAVSDRCHAVVYHPDDNREVRCRWPSSDRRPPDSIRPRPGPLLAAAFLDSLPVLLVLTGETLRFLDGFSGSEKAALAEGPGGFPGSPRAVCASGSAAYVAGEDREGASFLARLAGLGRAGRAVTLPLPSTTRVRALSVLGDWPALTAATDRGSDNLFIYSPTLAAASDNSPGYTNVRLLRAVPLHLDADSFADVAVIRTSADAGYRLDVFSNRLGELTAELKAAEGNLEHAVLGREENDVIRALRRVELLKAAVSPGTAPEADEKRLRSRFQAESRRRNLRTRGAVTTAALSLVAGIVLLLVLRRRRRAVPPGQQIENKQLPVRVALAADLVALDHNFLSKGNHQAAFERFVEVRDRHGLTLDRDLCRLTDAPTPGPLAPDPLPGIYSRAISRLIDSTPTVPVYELICKACRSAAGDRPLEELELTREGLRRMEHEPGFRLICIRSIEHPDIYRRLRWFSNPVLRGALEHFVVDHFRYADTWAAIVLDYLVNTQWNRRLLVRFLSDSSCSIDFRRQDGHLVSQTVDLAALLRPGIELPTYDSATAVPNEKLWLKNADYISVLEETRARLEGPTRQTGVSAPGVSLT